MRRILKITGALIFILMVSYSAFARADQEVIYATKEGIDTLWVLLAAFLVFLMQAGFGMLEAGLIRAKNACSILMKNFMDFCMASLGFFMFGYAIMFGPGNALFGMKGWFLSGTEVHGGVPLYANWLFHAVFCGAAATIVAGGVAERLKFPAYLAYSFLISATVYPVVGHWVWGGGWLSRLNFTDFAGSTVVHAVGGWAAFMGTVILGPRLSKFNRDGSANIIPGHSMALASLGTLLLWFAWFGFNPGSTLEVGDGTRIAHVAITTNLAAVGGAITAMFFAWRKFGTPDLSMTMNGALAGLVAITAPCAFVSPPAAIIIGAIGGIIVVMGTKFLDNVGVDDPVGAVPVHGMNGIWGTLAVGIFGRKSLGLAHEGLLYGGGWSQLGIQALGVFTVILFVIGAMFVVFKLVDAVIGLRVSREDELKGLDISQHGMESYAGFQIFSTQ